LPVFYKKKERLEKENTRYLFLDWITNRFNF